MNLKNLMVLFSIACLTIFIACAEAEAGPKLDIGDNSWMQLGLLGQAHYSYDDSAAKNEDFYLRRGRIIMSGQIADGIKFFMETDNDNAGRNGFGSVSTDIQDAWMDVQILNSDHWVQGGLILLPFSFENRSSAATLLGIDYNAEVIKLPNSFIWRDYGVELHGNFTKKFAYRIGAFEGYDASSAKKNDTSDLRAVGHIAFNILGEVETGWFYTQNRLGKSDYLSIGAGGNYQNKANLDNSVEIDDKDWVVDFQSGFNLGPCALTLNGGYYDWDNVLYKGDTVFGEIGCLIEKWMPTFKVSYLDPDHDDCATDYTYGIGYFFKDHNARVGLEFRNGDSPDWYLVGVQFFL